MMLPATPSNDGTVRVFRTLDVDEEDLLDAIAAFALEQDLEIDRRHEGEGLLFRRKAESTPGVSHLFKPGDALQVVVTADAHGHDVEFVADVSRSLRGKAEGRRGHVVRSTGLAGLFVFLGVRGLTNIVTVFDFALLGLGAMFGRRAMRYARSADDDFDEIERTTVNELNRVCDRALYGPTTDES